MKKQVLSFNSIILDSELHTISLYNEHDYIFLVKEY
jgi:hypothetical protein